MKSNFAFACSVVAIAFNAAAAARAGEIPIDISSQVTSPGPLWAQPRSQVEAIIP